MSKTCIVKFNSDKARWEAVYNNHILASSQDAVGGPDYLRKVIEGGFSNKAKNHGVTICQVIGLDQPQVTDTNEEPAKAQVTVENEFSINERFDIMQDYVEMVAGRALASALVTGEGGLGKTFTVMKSLKATGLQDITEMEIGARFDGQRGYVVVKGYSTPKGLFRTLFENKDQVIVFDDCDSVLRDPTAVNLLKAALDSYDERIVSWNAEGSFGSGDDMPKQFKFTGGVIFISNMSKTKIPQAIRSRAMCADVSMTRVECVERMRVIIQSDEFMPGFSDEEKNDAMSFVAEHAFHPLIQELNLRSLVNVVKARSAKPDSWKRLGLYSMANA